MHVARYWPSRTTTAVILWHSLLECLLVLVLLFGATTFVRWVIGPSPISSAIPTVRVRLLIIGAAVGVLLFGLILSPAGRAYGSHVLLTSSAEPTRCSIGTAYRWPHP
jgi:hypothetical protein